MLPYEKEKGQRAPDPPEKLVRTWQAAFEFEVGDHSFALPKSFGMAAVDVYEKITKKTDCWLSQAF